MHFQRLQKNTDQSFVFSRKLNLNKVQAAWRRLPLPHSPFLPPLHSFLHSYAVYMYPPIPLLPKSHIACSQLPLQLTRTQFLPRTRTLEPEHSSGYFVHSSYTASCVCSITCFAGDAKQRQLGCVWVTPSGYGKLWKKLPLHVLLPKGVSAFHTPSGYGPAVEKAVYGARTLFVCMGDPFRVWTSCVSSCGRKLCISYVHTTDTRYKYGEVIKEPLTDILLTNIDQITFSTLNTTLHVKIGDQLHAGDKIGRKGNTSLIVGISGQVIKIDQEQITLQKTQPVLFYSEADVHVKSGRWVEKGCPILTLTHQTLITGDIVQGIPKIEQLFEAPGGKEGEPLSETLHLQLRQIFRHHYAQLPLPQAVRRSLEEIQQILVEGIQKVYLSQGVLIADKHIEIVVRQMTSKGQILESGSTGLFLEEVLPIRQIESANIMTPGKKAFYMPAVIGLTRAALDAESFISAASFQETTRVLSRDAIMGKSDFLRGLKEKVVIGDLISAGTGLDHYFIYNILNDQEYIPANKPKNLQRFLKQNSLNLTKNDSFSRKKQTRKNRKNTTF